MKLDGVEASPTLIGIYPRVASSEGGTGGSTTHTHTAFVGNSGYSNDGGCSTGDGGGASTDHVHTMNHSHVETNHEPPFLEVLPITQGSSILTTMILFYDGSSAPSGWSTATELVDRFAKGSSTPGGTGGQVSHSHAYSGYSGYTSNGTQGTNDGRTNFNYGNHRHTISHTHSNGNNYPEWYGLLPIKPDSETGEIPSGVCAFFTGSTIPDGWSYFSGAEGKWVQGQSSSGGTGGANTHNHVYTGSSGSATPSSVVSGYNGSYRKAIIGAHTHTINHTESTENNIPPYQELMLLKKN